MNKCVLVTRCFFCRYSDFVVHEVNKEGRRVGLDDLCVPADVEVRGCCTRASVVLWLNPRV